MSLTSSMYAGISGLSSHSQQISIIGNNLANVSTMGYKSTSMQFQDLYYDAVGSNPSVGQSGYGVGIASVYTNFSQGPTESTSTATDVAISGDGFFIVENSTTGESYYTRAGNFRFNSNGYLVDPSGYRVQGWEVLDGQTGASTNGDLSDVRLDTSPAPPKTTENVFMSLNLNAESTDMATDTANPFFSVFSAWDGTAETPLSDTKYAYSNTITVYDENGGQQDLTAYFDPVDVDADGNIVWEYIVTCDPSADGRVIDGQNLSDTSTGGLLMSGTMTFDENGELVDMSAYTLKSTATGDLSDLSNWTAADLDEDGYPLLTANFAGSDTASGTDESGAKSISMNFGIASGNVSPAWSGGAATAAGVGTDLTQLAGLDTPTTGKNASTAYDEESDTNGQTQDGYGAGTLTGVTVDANGVVVGSYSNGVTQNLYTLGLASFSNPYGLHAEGGNLYAATTDSGTAVTGSAGSGNLGSVSSYTLEQSNVDQATEMVRLITAQRGFQANSKVITTADSLLGEIINLKR